jgi:hypothetical protein
LPLQSPRPGKQSPLLHAPSTHTGFALADTHAIPQVPQFCASVRVSVHCPAQHDIAAPPSPRGQRPSPEQPGTHEAPTSVVLQIVPSGQSPSVMQATHW